MPIKKKKSVKKKKSTGGLATYRRKIQGTPAVKSAASRVKKLESDLKAAKKKKAAAVKTAQVKYRRASK
jgi:hypothetical protein